MITVQRHLTNNLGGGEYMKTNIIRHGDVLLKRVVKIPVKAKEIKDKTLAYGEVTGHSHRFQDDTGIKRFNADGNVYLQVFSPSTLIHEEHNPIVIPIGEYQQIQEREHDYIEESARAVVD